MAGFYNNLFVNLSIREVVWILTFPKANNTHTVNENPINYLHFLFVPWKSSFIISPDAKGHLSYMSSLYVHCHGL